MQASRSRRASSYAAAREPRTADAYPWVIRRAFLSILPGAAAAGFIGLGIAIAGGWEPPGDRRLAEALYGDALGHAYSAELLLDWCLPAAGAFGLGLLAWLLARGRRGDAVFVLLAFGGTAAIELAGKSLVRRPSLNPADTDYSFPSGHAAAAAAVVAVVFVVSAANRRWLFTLFASIFATGCCVLVVARGWHYPSDVVGAVLAVLAWIGFLRRFPIKGGLASQRDEHHSAKPS